MTLVITYDDFVIIVGSIPNDIELHEPYYQEYI